MAYYPDVNSGEPFKPVASLENELRHMVNARDGFRGSASAVGLSQRLIVPVYNSGTDVLTNDIPVSFVGNFENFAEMGAVPVGKYVSGSRWGVLSAPLKPGEFGSCIVTGAVMVNYSGGDSPESLSPSTSGFVSGNEVTCLYASGGKAMIVLGAGSANTYNGYFTIKLRTLEDGTQKIVVCDGATYDAEKGTSGESVAYVGGVYHAVETIEIPVPKKSTHIIAEFTPAKRDDNGDVITESNVLVSTCDDLTSKEGFFSEIGQLRVEDTGLQVIQRHGTSGFSLFNNGTLFIDYYVRCNE